jgi:DNA modification methylase
MSNKEFTNKLILGDNLEIMKNIPDESVDLIYLDPPFFSNRTYEVIWGDDGERRSFEDRFAGDIDQYIHWLKIRVRQMYRILKPTGSIFLHCDWHASHYIKSQILDDKLLFGRNNFRNEIIWYYYNKMPDNRKGMFPRSTDTVFWYVKNNKEYCFNPLSEKRESPAKQLMRKKVDGKAINARDEQGNLMYRVRDEKLIDNVWRISMLQPADKKERIGYPTQKPEELLRRIIECCTKEGDIVLDPFVGGGTTVAVADKLNRRWIGIDQSVMAVKVTDLRLKKRQNEFFSTPYEVIIPTYDLSKLEQEDSKHFEIFIVEKFGGIPNLKGGKDYGIDGHTEYGTPIQVKKWKKPVGRAVLDEFLTAIQRDDKYLFEKNKKEGQVCGFIIGFEFSRDIINEVAKLKNNENTIIELKYIRNIIPYENPPKVMLTAKESEEYKYRFEADAESKSGIDFYSWDFSHNEKEFKVDVVMDKKGKQEKKFTEGEHKIAVKAIDKHGLSGMDKVKIKVKRKSLTDNKI